MEVRSVSMERTLSEGDRVVLDSCGPSLWYADRKRSCAPNLGQIVVFRSIPNDSLIVKRVIALGGDTIRIKEGSVLVNGAALSEPYVQHSQAYIPSDDSWPTDNRAQIRQVVVPAGCYFVLGDNRDESVDSRVLGPIRPEMIVGVIKLRIPRHQLSGHVRLVGLE